MAEKDPDRDPASIVNDYMTAHPDASLNEIAKYAVNELKTPIAWNHIALLRLRWLKLNGRPTGVIVVPLPPEPEAAIISKPVCSNCGGMHWISQCPQPFKQKEPISLKPLPLTQLPSEAPQPAVQEKPTMQDVTEVKPTTKPPASPPLISAKLHEAHLGRQKRKGVWIRRAYLNELLEKDPGMDPQAALVMVRERFGMGISVDYTYETCRIARQIHDLPQIPTSPGAQERNRSEPVELDEEADLPLEEDLTLAAQQLGEVVRAQRLTSLTITVKDGKARWSYSIERAGEGEVAL